MKNLENTFQEIKDTNGAPNNHGLEMVADKETTEVTKSLDTLHDAITHDRPITESTLSGLTTAIGALSIDVGGTTMSVAEVEKIPDLKRNMEIFKEIQSGDISNSHELTFITPLIAEHLSKHEGNLWLNGLTTLSDIAAEHLSKHEGALWLNGLNTLSDTAAEHLSKHEGNLYLSGLTTLSDTAAEYLSKHKGDLDLKGLTTLSDTAAEHLSKHEGYLWLNSLTTLSDTAAEHLSKHEGRLYLDSLTTLSDIAAEHLSKHGDLRVSEAIRSKINTFK